MALAFKSQGLLYRLSHRTQDNINHDRVRDYTYIITRSRNRKSALAPGGQLEDDAKPRTIFRERNRYWWRDVFIGRVEELKRSSQINHI